MAAAGGWGGRLEFIGAAAGLLAVNFRPIAAGKLITLSGIS